MPAKKLTIDQYRSSAVMWAFAVEETEERLRSVRDDHLQAHHHGQVRRAYERASEGEKTLLHAELAEATRVMTVASSWRMSLARHEFLTAAAQLQKCVDWLRAHKQEIPELPNEEFIKLLRDISEHWEQIADRKSRGRFKDLRPDERPGSVRYGQHRIEVGAGLVSHDVVEWAQKVDSAVREQGSAAGQELLKPEESIEHLFYNDPPNP